ncbi:cyclopropane fatty acyl phospholipid synthase [Pedobacter sp. KBW06]|uniref:cyclopropane fatty acyl phospholipid synthase n=1 Tax=Pedobacter sp. KBW06 TaxID=2153359 RepID=UPI000F5AF693|nr:cyclopropane fatty acyl phospholipid synthase [Pedobacter sp. KBW06]RQO69875.1 cyclopropane fatty acyl phospholipid synthase [Pedobacter sp. KBW06]
MNRYQSTIETLISPAGIHLNGTDDFDIHVYDDRFYRHVLRYGSLGLGESYMNEWWDCKALDTFLYRLLTVNLEKRVRHHLQWQSLKAKIFNLQSITRAVEVAKKHYNIGNDLFEKMLDKYMIYSCAYWSKASTLEEAQEDKLDLICRKLKLSAGMEILDIGCGWGGLAQFAAERYQVKVTGVTISSEQAALARKRCEGLPVRILLEDYRLLTGSYDRIVSVGMFEHVGYKNYDTFMKVVKQCLRKDGIFLLHCIGGNESGIHTDPWIDRYIFPNGMMPSPTQISNAAEPYFALQDWHNFGLDYDRTLMEWLKRFRNSWDQIKAHYDDQFYRMWEYYLCISAASFRAHKNNLWQIVYTHPDYPERYSGVR